MSTATKVPPPQTAVNETGFRDPLGPAERKTAIHEGAWKQLVAHPFDEETTEERETVREVFMPCAETWAGEFIRIGPGAMVAARSIESVTVRVSGERAPRPVLVIRTISGWMHMVEEEPYLGAACELLELAAELAACRREAQAR